LVLFKKYSIWLRNYILTKKYRKKYCKPYANVYTYGFFHIAAVNTKNL